MCHNRNKVLKCCQNPQPIPLPELFSGTKIKLFFNYFKMKQFCHLK